MKSLSILMAFGLFIVAQAQQECLPIAAKIPRCATECLARASEAVSCAVTDFKCQCTPEKTAAITNAALACVIAACGPQTGLLVQSAAAAVCECAAAAPAVTSIPPSATPAASKPATSDAPVASTSNREAPVTFSSRPASSTAAFSTAMPPFPTTTSANSGPSRMSPSGTLGSSSRPFSPSGSSSSAPFTGGSARTVGSVTALLVVMFAAMLVL